MISKTLDEEANETLRSALRQGIVDPLLRLPDIDPRMFRHLEEAQRLEGHKGPTPQQSNPLQNPRSRRYQENSYFPPIGQTAGQTGWQSLLCELARIAVPEGQIGYLRRIDQEIADLLRYKSTFDWLALPTWYFNCGINWFDEPEIDDCRWFLRIQPFHGQLPPRLNLIGLPAPDNHLPGDPYSELAEWRGFWQRSNDPRDFWSIIPGMSLLRFFVWVPATVTYHWYVHGRLTAQTQSAYSAEAEMGARMGWNR